MDSGPGLQSDQGRRALANAARACGARDGTRRQALRFTCPLVLSNSHELASARSARGDGEDNGEHLDTDVTAETLLAEYAAEANQLDKKRKPVLLECLHHCVHLKILLTALASEKEYMPMKRRMLALTLTCFIG